MNDIKIIFHTSLTNFTAFVQCVFRNLKKKKETQKKVLEKAKREKFT